MQNPTGPLIVILTHLMLVFVYLPLASSVFRLTSDLTAPPIPDNLIIKAIRYTLHGQTQVAAATRSVYKCTAFTGLWPTYNSLEENITDIPPAKDEMLEWVHHKMTKIGPIVYAGVGDDFSPCLDGNEFTSSTWVKSSVISKTCYHSHTLRTSCFVTWSTSLTFHNLPTFLEKHNDSNLLMYAIAPANTYLSPSILSSNTRPILY